MPSKPVSLKPRSTELLKGKRVVGFTDRIYDISGPTVTFGEVSIKGDLSGEIEYNGKRLRVVRIDAAVGLLVGPAGARGPVWQGVECEVID